MPADRRRTVSVVRLVAVLGVFCAASAGAHSQSSSRLFLELSESRTSTLSIDLALIDLTQAMTLDLDRDGAVTWGELQSSGEPISAFVEDGVQIVRGGNPCRLETGNRDFSLVQRSGIPNLRIRLPVLCPAEAEADVHVMRYSLFFDINPAHRALLHVSGASNESAHVFSPARPEVRLTGDASPLSAAVGFVGAGIHHILSGYDHLIFLALLILPAAGSSALREKLVRIAVIVTAFTVAHSITLAAATTGAVSLPERPVEIGIAASIVLAAAINIVRPSHRLGWKVAFAFGLLHGFGFAGALREMGLERDTLLSSLLAFNVGVELGQLLVVALILPILVWLSASTRYRPVVVPAVSLAGASLGVVWTAARL